MDKKKIKPRRFKPINLIVPDTVKPDFETSPIIHCPLCNCHIPILPEYIDYRTLYEAQQEYTKKIIEEFNNYLDSMFEEVEDAKIWAELRKQELLDQLERIRRLLDERYR